ERDGGINGVKIVFEECDTGYATDRGVECYERLKGKGSTGAAYVLPLSTGITFALTEKAPADNRSSPWVTAARIRAMARCSNGISPCSARIGLLQTSFCSLLLVRSAGGIG